MSYTVELLNFEGPLHLLWQLIDQNELEITEISLAAVTEQYLQHINGLSTLEPNELNQFVELAAKLIHIKSQALLPGPQEPEYQEDLQELTHQLEEYRRYQAAGKYLENLLKQGQASWSRQAPKPLLDSEKLELPNVSAAQLQSVFKAALARIPQLPQDSIADAFTLEQAATLIREAVKSNSQVELSTILQTAGNRSEALVLFLSLLELWRAGHIGVHQENPFGAIIVIDG